MDFTNTGKPVAMRYFSSNMCPRNIILDLKFGLHLIWSIYHEGGLLILRFCIETLPKRLCWQKLLFYSSKRLDFLKKIKWKTLKSLFRYDTGYALSKDIYVIEQSEKKNGYSRKTLQWYLTEWRITNKMSVFAVIPWAA